MEGCPCGTNAEACLEAGGLGGGLGYRISRSIPRQGGNVTNAGLIDFCPLGLMTLN